MKRKERVNKIKSMKKADLQKERVTLIEQIFSRNLLFVCKL